MAEPRYRHEDVSAVPAGWKVRTVSHGDHRVRVAFPPGRKKTGSGRLVSILHPTGENPCGLRSSNPAELVIMGANPPRRRRNAGIWVVMLIKRGGTRADAVEKEFETKEEARAFAKSFIKADKKLTGGKTQYLRPQIFWEPKNPSSPNPRVEVIHGDNPQLETIVEEFTGAPAEWVDVYDEPHLARGQYAQLGPLIALYVKPADGGQVRRIGAPEIRKGWRDYWEDNPPMIVTDHSAKKIYFVGGNQDITPSLEQFGGRDYGNGICELGKVRRIDYECRKEHVATPAEDQWKHDHGEENGVFPTLLFDTSKKRLMYEGGDYRIEGAWIRN